MNPLRWKLLTVACGLALLPACSDDDGRIKIAIVTNVNDPFWNAAEEGAMDAGEKLGVNVTFRRPDNGTAEEQEKIINDFLDDGAKGIAVSVIDPINQSDYLSSVAKKAKLATQDNDAPESARIFYVGTDNVAAGAAAGKLVTELMPDGGHYAVFVGSATALNARQRYEGVISQLTDPKYTRYQDLITDDKDPVKIKNNAIAALESAQIQEAIAKGEKVTLVGLWAPNAPGILDAVESKGLLDKVGIVGFDENPATLDGIDEGKIHGTIVQNPYLFGFESVRVLKGLVEGEELRDLVPEDVEDPAVYHIKHRVFTKDGGVVDGEQRYKASEFAKVYQDQRAELKGTE